MKLTELTPEFVREIPLELEYGKLYISCRYRAVTHLCPCGCGVKINTPLHPTGWSLSYDGLSVSLSSSVGNWSEKCRSHYWITNNKVRWATALPWWKIHQTRRARDLALEQYFAETDDSRTAGRSRPAVTGNTEMGVVRPTDESGEATTIVMPATPPTADWCRLRAGMPHVFVNPVSAPPAPHISLWPGLRERPGPMTRRQQC